jgi:hypothetical protein
LLKLIGEVPFIEWSPCSSKRPRIGSGSDDESSSDSMLFLSSASSRSDFFPSDEDGLSSQDRQLKEVSDLFIGRCCNELCLRNVTVNDILSARNTFSEINPVQQRQWLADRLIENSVIGGKNGKPSGKEVCEASFCQVYKFSPKSLSRLRKEIPLNDSLEHGNKGGKKTTKKPKRGILI